jgi:hypothetical protein
MGYLSKQPVPRTSAAKPKTKTDTKTDTKPKKLHSYHMFCKETLALYSEEELANIEAKDGPRQKWRICSEAWKVLKAQCDRGDWDAVQRMAALRKAADEHNSQLETSKSTARMAVTTEQWSCQVCLMANPGSHTVCICCGRAKGTVPSPILQRAHGRVVQEDEGHGESKGESEGDDLFRPGVLDESFDGSPEGHEEVEKVLAHKYLKAARTYIFLLLFKGDPRPQWVNCDECQCHELIVEYFETKRPWDGVSPYSPLDLYLQHRIPFTTAPFR